MESIPSFWQSWLGFRLVRIAQDLSRIAPDRHSRANSLRNGHEIPIRVSFTIAPAAKLAWRLTIGPASGAFLLTGAVSGAIEIQTLQSLGVEISLGNPLGF
jgi:hypothetical protein